MAVMQGQQISVSYEPSPLRYIVPKQAAIDDLLTTSSNKDPFICKVKVRDVRRPEIGDKFSSRHGQKGV